MGDAARDAARTDVAQPGLFDDVPDTRLAHLLPCPRCDGVGWLPNPVLGGMGPCPLCYATRLVAQYEIDAARIQS